MSKEYAHEERVARLSSKKWLSDLPCYGCNKRDTEVKFRHGILDPEGTKYWFCADCDTGKAPSIPDVWYGYGSGVQTEENICDPGTGQPIPFYDRTSKAAAMKKAGVQEAGDTFHGARTTFRGGKHN